MEKFLHFKITNKVYHLKLATGGHKLIFFNRHKGNLILNFTLKCHFWQIIVEKEFIISYFDWKFNTEKLLIFFDTTD